MDRTSISLRCLGTGDAFGSGGRLNSCYHLKHTDGQMLIDCGSSSLIAMQRFKVIPAEIDTVVISHFHGDHFGGIPYLILEGQYASQRTRPLTLVGPAGLKQRVEAVCEALYPGMTSNKNSFPVKYLHLNPKKPLNVNAVQIESFHMKHGRHQSACGLRLSVAGKIISYTGDTEWTDRLIPLAHGSDLMISECYSYDNVVAGHLNYQTLLKNRMKLKCRKLVLTHLGPEMISRIDQLELDTVNDGELIEING